MNVYFNLEHFSPNVVKKNCNKAMFIYKTKTFSVYKFMKYRRNTASPAIVNKRFCAVHCNKITVMVAQIYANLFLRVTGGIIQHTSKSRRLIFLFKLATSPRKLSYIFRNYFLSSFTLLASCSLFT